MARPTKASWTRVRNRFAFVTRTGLSLFCLGLAHAVAATCVPLLALLASPRASAEPDVAGIVRKRPEPPEVTPRDAFTGTLRVLTLNMAHGRKDAFNQIFVTKETIERNLTEIAALVRQTQADVAALQEADGPSRWSGNFDHVTLLAHKAGYPWYARAGHAKSWLFDYGTALLSQVPFVETFSHDFEPTPPSPTKGMLLGQIAWPPDRNTGHSSLVDIVSVHLDFSRQSVRAQQLAEMMEVLATRTNPIIILGDFNSDWFSDESLLTRLVDQCRLRVYRPLATDLGTYHSGQRRLDWIFLSAELEFVGYNVLTGVVSDHYAVVADIRLKERSTVRRARTDTEPLCNEPARIENHE